MSLAVSVRHVDKEFLLGDGKTKVLDNVCADIPLGKLTMLVGPSGCGKTTLISIMSGILSPTAGEITLLGHSLSSLSDTEKVLLRRKHVGFIFQQYNLLPALTAAENAAIPLLAAGVPEGEAFSRAAKILEQLGMGEHVSKLPRQLSGGQQQRVAIGRALVHDPQLIVCDEPTAALDATTGLGIMEILHHIAQDPKRAVLIVTHDNRIYRFADRILEMSDGRIVGEHTPDTFKHKE